MDSNTKVLAIQESAENHQLQIVERIKETLDAFTYVFSPVTASQRFPFTVGQFVTISALLKRPTATGNLDERIVQRTYSIASSPKRDLIELTIKCEKPYGHINPITRKPDGFAAYFFEQMKIGDKVNVRFNPNKDHFLSRIAKGMEKNIAYWSGANGAESARCLIQYNNTVNVIYYNWLVDMAKKMENLKVVFTFPEKKNQISRVIILELFTGKVGSSLIQKENRRE